MEPHRGSLATARVRIGVVFGAKGGDVVRWDQGRFQVERKCEHTGGQRAYECGARGWHVVDTHNDGLDALRDASDLLRETGVPHRVADQATGELLGDPS